MTHTWLSVYPPLPPRAWTRRRRSPPPFPLAEPSCRLFARARDGLYRALRLLGPEPGDELLMPAYHHGSEIETARQAGFTPRFYDAVEPADEQLEALLGPRTRGLFVIDALGLPGDLARLRRWCDHHGLALIEDGAQAWLSARDGVPAGAAADIAIFCLYKCVGVPDGGAVVTSARVGTVPEPRGRGSSVAAVARLHRDHLAQRHARLAALRGGVAAAHLDDELPERDFRASPDAAGATRASGWLGRRIDGPAVAARRRANPARLRERLGERLSPAFPDPGDGGSPLAFAVETHDKRGLLDHLAGHGVIGGKLWAVAHPLLAADRYPRATALRRRLVGLPVHQELRDRDLDRIASVAEAWFRRGR